MKKRKIVYCEMGFLKSFIKNRPEVHRPSERTLAKAWDNLYDFLCKADIVLDTTEEEFMKEYENDEWLQDLWKFSSDGYCGLDFQTNTFVYLNQLNPSNLKEESLNAVYLSTLEDDLCQKKSMDYGVIAMNVNSYGKCEHLYKDKGATLPRGEKGDWSFMDHINKKIPQLKFCNTMILVDKYIFKDNSSGLSYKDKIDSNLHPILDYILPTELVDGLEFQLIVVTGEKYEPYKNQYEYLCSVIKDIRPKLACRITMCNCDRFDFHDRSIATNNVWIDCPHGFDIFKPGEEANVSPTTKVLIAFPLIQHFSEQVDNSYLRFIKDVKDVVYRKSNGLYKYGEGNPVNPVISYYTKREFVDVTKLKPGDKIPLSVLNKMNKKRRCL